MIIVNFKTYSESSGEKAREIGEACEKASKETGVDIVTVPQSQDLLRLEDLDVKVFSQHIDPIEPGSHTGSVLAEDVKDAGVTGTLINHSEKRLPPEKIKETVEKTREEGLTSVVCAQSPEECGKFSKYNPDFIAYEPKELIGGSISVSSAKPELIEEAVEKSGNVPTLTGAGIKDSEDVRKSLELGCKGVLVASGVIKSDDSFESIKELCNGYDN